LKTSVRLHSSYLVVFIWLTCCAFFHNWLLKIDGLNKPFDGVNSVTSEWANELGALEEQDIPFAMKRLLSPSEIWDYNSSRLGGNNVSDTVDVRNLDGEFEDDNSGNNNGNNDNNETQTQTDRYRSNTQLFRDMSLLELI